MYTYICNLPIRTTVKPVLSDVFIGPWKIQSSKPMCMYNTRGGTDAMRRRQRVRAPCCEGVYKCMYIYIYISTVYSKRSLTHISPAPPPTYGISGSVRSACVRVCVRTREGNSCEISKLTPFWFCVRINYCTAPLTSPLAWCGGRGGGVSPLALGHFRYLYIYIYICTTAAAVVAVGTLYTSVLIDIGKKKFKNIKKLRVF